jgi:ABC-type polar amino acid transport system ATPase subunit
VLRHLKLSAHGILDECRLLDLGRINVICGKNNSGKTTVLTSIVTKDRATTGMEINADNVLSYALQYTAGTIFRNGDALNRAGNDVRALAGEVFGTQKVWFANERTEFFKPFAAGWKKYQALRGYGAEDGRSNPAFQALFPTFPKSCLVPPKRNLELVVGFSVNSKVEPSGAGLLNHLFQLKNQEIGTAQRSLYDEVSQAFQHISGGYTFDVISGGGSGGLVLRLRTPKGQSANASDCGLGMQDLLILVFFSLEPEANLVLIEEPESHLHPEMQRKLLQFMTDQGDKQFIFSTHSNVFLDGAYVEKVFFTTYSGRVSVRDETNRALILSDLGYQVSDNLVSDLIILVEGPKDVPVLEAFLQKLGVLGNFAIKFWPLGGDIMDQVDLSVFAEKYTIVALIDQDPKSDAVRKRFVDKCTSAGVTVHRLKRYALENYFSLRAIREVFGSQVPSQLTELKDDVPVEKQLGLSVKKRTRNIARAMELDEFVQTDLGSFLSSLADSMKTQAIKEQKA